MIAFQDKPKIRALSPSKQLTFTEEFKVVYQADEKWFDPCLKVFIIPVRGVAKKYQLLRGGHRPSLVTMATRRKLGFELII